MSGIQGKQQMTKMLDALRASPPKEMAGLRVTGFEDLRDERGRMGPIKGATDYASRNVLIFHLGDRARIILRPSGTEPKAKGYIEACTPPCPPGTSAEGWRGMCQDTDVLVKHLADVNAYGVPIAQLRSPAHRRIAHQNRTVRVDDF